MFSKSLFSLPTTIPARVAGASVFVAACAMLAGCARHVYPVYAPPPVIIVHHGYAPPPVIVVHHGYGGYGYGGAPVVHVYPNGSPYGSHPYGGGVVHVYHHYRH